jgi:hypothetical protein
VNPNEEVNCWQRCGNAQEFGIQVEFTETDDVPMLVAKSAHEDASDTPWEDLPEEKQKHKI